MTTFRFTAILSFAALAALASCDSPADPGPDPVATVVIAPDTSFVRINTTAQLQASARSENGEVLTGVAIAWSSSDSSIAAVSTDGMVTARAYGKVVVTATADGVSDAAVVWVTGTPGLRVVSGEGVEDTIWAPLPARLVVELRDERGVPAAGERVYFQGLGRPGSPNDPTMELQGPFGYSIAALVTTDSLGMVSVGGRMGLIAGPGAILARSDRLGYADTARYTVRVGAPARLQVTPADSALFPGRTLALRTAIADRGRNPLTGAVSFSVLEGPVSVNAAGVVSGVTYGTARVEGRIGIAVDTMRVVVVPEGAMVAVSGDGMILMNFDGTAKRVLGGSGRGPAWSPSGDRLVYQSEAFSGTLVTRTLTGPPTPLIAQETSGWHHWPQYSRDGQWVYYFSSAPNEPQTIWRVRADGTGLQKVSPSGNQFEGHPSPSPDGTRIAYFVGGGLETYIHVRDLGTGQQSGRLARGHAPTWSPMADLIAFNELGAGPAGEFPAAIAVVKPDGTGLRRVSAPGHLYDFSPRWSPDGRWIIASAYGKVHLIQVETGLTIELPFLESVRSVDWKPGGLLP